jgi:hypothetical protein
MRGRAGKQVIALKPATEPTAASQVIKTTTTRISSIDPSEDRSTPDLWTYLESLNTKNGTEWDRHLIYIYRVEPGPSVPVEKCARYLNMPDGTQVSMSDQEAVEFALMQKYGGKVFRLIVKRGNERVTQGRVYVDAPVRPITVQPDMSGQGTGAQVAGNTMGDAAQIAGKAIDTIAGADHQAVRIGIDALGAAANIVRSFGTAPTVREGGGDDITKQFMQVMIARAMQDPFEQFLRFMTVMREMNNVAGTPGAAAGMPADMMQQFMKAMFEKFMNPQPAGAPVSASAELVRQLPQIGSTVAESLREFRMAREAELNIVRLQRPGPPAIPGQAQVIPPANGPATPPPTNGAPSMEFVEQRLVEILRQPVSAAQAADDAMAFLDGLDPNSIKELAKLGEGGLISLFQNRPVLKQATNNMPRLVEFIRAFLQLHAEDLAAAAAEAAQAPSPKEPLPN